jgi:Bacterial PH domain/Domain of unknown function (DUF1648)
MSHNAEIFKAHHSEKTKYYGLIFIIIIAIPISIILFVTLQGPIIFSALMFTVLIGVLFLLAYLSLSTGNARYELSNKNLSVIFGLIKKRINYTRIVEVEIVNLKLVLRLFGASLPGFHWGFYKTSIGNAHVYATRIEGKFILITLDDGEKIAISPEESERFLEAIEEKKYLFKNQTGKETTQQTQSMKKAAYIQVLAVSIAYIAFLGYFFWVYTQLPQIVPLHFGFNGVANRFGDKSELLWVAGIAAMLPIINAILTLKFGKYERGLVLLLGTIFIVSVAVFIYATYAIASVT